MKEIEFLGNSLKELQEFPEGARRKAGFELWQVQRGLEPDDSKSMPDVGAGVQEMRIWEADGTFRVLYIARLEDAVYVLRAFQKKNQATPKRDLEIARKRLKVLIDARKKK